jgi:DnaJ-class molecular chaperone
MIAQADVDEKGQAAAQIQFQILQAAYETLKDPEKRVRYDRGQALGSSEEY